MFTPAFFQSFVLSLMLNSIVLSDLWMNADEDPLESLNLPRVLSTVLDQFGLSTHYLGRLRRQEPVNHKVQS